MPLSSAIVLIALSFAMINSSSTNLALLGLVQKILNKPGCAISPMARLAEPVPLELPSERPESMASITCCAPANLSASTSSPASLKYPFSIAAKNGKPAATGQYPMRIFGVCARRMAGAPNALITPAAAATLTTFRRVVLIVPVDVGSNDFMGTPAGRYDIESATLRL